METDTLSRKNAALRMILLSSLYFRLMGKSGVNERDMADLNDILSLVKRTPVLGITAFAYNGIWANVRQSDVDKLVNPFDSGIDEFVEMLWDKKPVLARYATKEMLKEDLNKVIKLANRKIVVNLMK